MTLPLVGEWSEYDWDQVLGDNKAPGREDIDEVTHQYFRPGESGYAEMDLVAVMRLKDGRWASVHGGCDTTGWGCQDYIDWRYGTSLNDIVVNGLTNQSRGWLNLELPGEADGGE